MLFRSVQEAVIAFVMDDETHGPNNTNKLPADIAKDLSKKSTIANPEQQRKTMKLVAP